MNEATLTLFIPDLFGLQSTFSQIPKNEIPQLPVLEKWLSRGEWSTYIDQNDIIFKEFIITHPDLTKQKPLSAFALYAEKSGPVKDSLSVQTSSYWLRADPICIQPDRDTAVVMAHEELALTQEEANKLVEEINAHFSDEPWKIHALHPHRWYLEHNTTQDLQTTPLFKVLNQDVNPYLPKGGNAKYWTQCANEIQMLLHGSNINFERESRGCWPVNSVWLWGGGALPESNKITTTHTKIISNNIVMQGIGKYYNIEIRRLDENFINDIDKGNSFIMLDILSEPVTRRDVFNYIQKLKIIEDDYFKNIDTLLKNGSIKEVRLLSDNKMSVSITPKNIRRWWKRHKAFAEF